MNHLSMPSSLNCKSFDLSTEVCSDICYYGIKKYCYALPINNIHEIYKARKTKINKNLDFLNSDDFVNEFIIELKINCISHFRFFSSGDITNVEQLIKIMQVIEKSPQIKFWLPTYRHDILVEYFEKLGLKKPKNVNILYSLPSINFDIPKFLKNWLKFYKIGYSNVTTKIKKVNCHKSIDHKNCGTCFKCFDDKKIIYLMHGKRAISKFKKTEEIKNE